MRKLMVIFMIVLSALPIWANNATDALRFIEVNGVAQVEVVPDRVHYIVQLREYFIRDSSATESDVSETRVPIGEIDDEFRAQLKDLGIAEESVRLQAVGDYGWRRDSEPFYVSKRYDITIKDFSEIDRINDVINRNAVEYLQLGELESDSMDYYRRQCRVEALKAAREKAEYMAQALNAQVDDVLQIIEPENAAWVESAAAAATSNAMIYAAAGYNNFRTISLRATVRVRFSLKYND